MTLEEKREQWEKGSEEELCVTHNIDGYKTVLVIVYFRQLDMRRKHQLFRYFKIGENWEVSCDIDGMGFETLELCLKAVTKRFEDIKP